MFDVKTVARSITCIFHSQCHKSSVVVYAILITPSGTSLLLSVEQSIITRPVERRGNTLVVTSPFLSCNMAAVSVLLTCLNKHDLVVLLRYAIVASFNVDKRTDGGRNKFWKR